MGWLWPAFKSCTTLLLEKDEEITSLQAENEELAERLDELETLVKLLIEAQE